ncbi:CP2 transcription factor-domain-containing protein [Radiomyces spectabilis]|uniref:CP2 transcription factor-domain-containing protein n=1 Tax=Radiomyces spectabilis TaxID=64574 RepID=UPI00221E72C5|nr:CP2 transcription factor-domain-containing protein [Radiomyces spectabilis]KAI8376452.1 CP2 transcription factor-domain-containing protein [Radiomyces spectabilis]
MTLGLPSSTASQPYSFGTPPTTMPTSVTLPLPFPPYPIQPSQQQPQPQPAPSNQDSSMYAYFHPGQHDTMWHQVSSPTFAGTDRSDVNLVSPYAYFPNPSSSSCTVHSVASPTAVDSPNMPCPPMLHHPIQSLHPINTSHKNRQYHPRHRSANATMTSTFMPRTPVSFASPPPPMPSPDENPCATNIPVTRTEKIPLRFHVVLRASTAALQKTEDAPITYLNRGQAYAIQLQDKQGYTGTLTSTFVIMFHDPSHRKVALNYWNFWISQQDNTQDIRAIDLDANQSSGIFNIRFPSFDRITFDWHGHRGARIFVRFNCLSTDFSRIKGVKGIPLRAHMETQVAPSPTADMSATSPTSANRETHEMTRYGEECFCKIKLFRDKGAERKNKDDARQISKQLDKIMAEGDPRQHPLWRLYNQPIMPYSVFSEIPTSPTPESMVLSAPESPASLVRRSSTTTTVTSPSIYSPAQNFCTPGMAPSSTSTQMQASPVHALPSTMRYTNQLIEDAYHSQPSYPPAKTSGTKRARSETGTRASAMLSSSEITHSPEPGKRRLAMSLFVEVKPSQYLRHPTSSPLTNDESIQLQRIYLEHLTVQELVVRLCSILSLHPSQVSQVLWRRSKSEDANLKFPHEKTKKNYDQVLVLVEDAVIAQHFVDGIKVAVEWEIKSDGTVRLLLQF